MSTARLPRISASARRAPTESPRRFSMASPSTRRSPSATRRLFPSTTWWREEADDHVEARATHVLPPAAGRHRHGPHDLDDAFPPRRARPAVAVAYVAGVRALRPPPVLQGRRDEPGDRPLRRAQPLAREQG